MMEEHSRLKQFVNRWISLCPVLMILAAAGLLMAFGLTIWTALLVAVLLVCPALMIWGAITLRHTIWGRPHAR
jgi:hypothetical protein